MSDPIRNADIEDVLSSIRRLVADGEVGPMPTAAAKPAAPTPEEAPVVESDKLVLTAAFRVQDNDAEPDTAEEAPQKVAEPVFAHGVLDPQHSIDTDAESVPEQEEEPQDPTPFLRAHDNWEEISLEDRIAELEAAVSKSDEEWEPDGSEMAPTPETFDALEAANDGAEAAVSDDQPEPTVEEQVEDWLAVDTSHEEEATSDEAQPTQAHTEAAEAVDAATAQAEPQPAAQEATDAGEDTAAASDREDDTWSATQEDDALDIDEDALREMVMNIVREELQGALGERITRNVRKLVRREINRAMSSRDFE